MMKLVALAAVIAALAAATQDKPENIDKIHEVPMDVDNVSEPDLSRDIWEFLIAFRRLSNHWRDKNGLSKKPILMDRYSHVGRKRSFRDELAVYPSGTEKSKMMDRNAHVGMKKQSQDEWMTSRRNDKEGKDRYGHIGRK